MIANTIVGNLIKISEFEFYLNLVESGADMSRGDAEGKKRPPRFIRRSILWGCIALFIIIVLFAEPNAVPYRIAAALNGAVFGAIGGGLGAILEFVIKRRWGLLLLR